METLYNPVSEYIYIYFQHSQCLEKRSSSSSSLSTTPFFCYKTVILYQGLQLMMALSAKTYPHGLKIAATVILISSLSFLPSKSVGTMQLSSDSKSQQQRKMVLGSRPPVCENKCMSCRPCMATLVIPPPPQDNKKSFKESSSSHRDDKDDYYYLLSWKCKCGDKLYQP